MDNSVENNTVTETLYDAMRIAQICFLLIIFLLGICFNILVLVVYIFSPTVRKVKSNLGVINLILCDLIFVFIVIPMSFISLTFPNSYWTMMVTHGSVCQMTGFLSVTVCTLSSLTLACIAIDRYIAAVNPLSYSKIIHQKFCIIILGFCWIWAMLTAMPPILPHKPAVYIYHSGTKHCSPSFRSDCWYFWYCTIMGYGIPLPIMTFCYIKIYLTLRNQRRKIVGASTLIMTDMKPTVAIINDPVLITEKDSVWSVNPNKDIGLVGITDTATKSTTVIRKVAIKMGRKPQVHIAKRGALLIIAYFLCWGPYALLFSCPGHIHAVEWVEVMAMWIVYSLVVWNPLIYVFNNHQFRLATKRLILKLKTKTSH